MKQWFTVGVLAAAGLLSLAIGTRAMIAPESLSQALALRPVGADGLNEIRAQYGGFFLAVAALSLAAMVRVSLRQTALITLIVTFGGILLGRVVSAALDGGLSAYGPKLTILYAVDAIGLGAALAALFLESRGGDRDPRMV